MPSIEMEFNAYCNECGDGLCRNVSQGEKYVRGKTEPYINIVPCEKCLQKRYDEGYKVGKNSIEE